MSEFSAALFDDRSAKRRAIRVRLDPAGLAWRPEIPEGEFPPVEPEAWWFWREVRQRPPEFANDPVVFERKNTLETIEFADAAIIDEIRRVAPGVAVTGGQQASRRLGRLALAAILALPVLVWGTWRFIPWFGEKMAAIVPVALEDRLGSSVADYVARQQRICESRVTLDAVSRITGRLDEVGQRSPYRMRVRVVREREVNALAAPGGHIVVYQGLIDLTSNESELAGVLAHEVVHVRRRHTTKSIFRQMGLWAGLAVLTGDVSGSVAAIAGTAGILQFSRAYETEADLEGFDLLQAAGFDVGGMGVMFRKLEEKGGSFPELLRYLSTHPDAAERIRAIDQRSGRTTPRTVSYLPDPSWRPVRDGCAVPKK